MLNEFTSEIIQELGFYVYRLIDPRNGQTFYVGKGRGNRIFQHARQEINYCDNDEKQMDPDPNKLKTIRDIRENGLEVIHIIQRWGLTEKEALHVEAALIDCYQGLTNIQRGYHSDDYGVTNTQILINRFSRKIYNEPTDFKYLIVKVQQWRLDELLPDYNKAARYEATRGNWRIKPKSVSEYPFAFSVTGGIVCEVYKIIRWEQADSGRYFFEGEVASDAVRNQVIGYRIPEEYCKKGMASPVLFSKNKIE